MPSILISMLVGAIAWNVLVRIWRFVRHVRNADVLRVQAEHRAESVERRVNEAKAQTEIMEGRALFAEAKLKYATDHLAASTSRFHDERLAILNERDNARMEAARRLEILSKLKAQVESMPVMINAACLMCGAVHTCQDDLAQVVKKKPKK